MGLAPGTRLGPYEIQAAVGAGGMGEVYKARDTRLDRTVAIKVLPEYVASNPELKQRFEREAKTLASLSHPHICPVFDVGSQEAIDFLVMEHLEGETLEQRLKKGALSLDQALRTAIEIANALAAAHRAGVVHRDLKPGNIMLTKGGAKLLDFGLAKRQPAGAVAGVSLAATVSSPMTGQGTILGTPQYMAPEQVEGGDADTRSDLFAFGAILYEMMTGRRAFEGKSTASVMAAILEREPAAISTIQPLVPLALDRMVTRCLAKAPDSRWQSAADLEDELRWIAAGGGKAVGPPERRGRSARLTWTLLAMGGLTIVALSVPAVIHLREQPASRPEVRFELTTPATRQPLHFAISPDGEHLVFVASGDGAQRLWHRPLAAVTARPLGGTEGAEYPFWSPDSRAVGFFASGQLKRIDLAGGPPQNVTAAPNGRGGAWNRDGTILFAPTNASALVRVDVSGGEPHAVTALDPPRYGSHRWPQFLPDGRRFLFFAQGNPEGQGIYLGSLDGTRATRLTPADAAGAYAEPGALVFMQQNALVVRRFDVASGRLTGDPVTLADRVSYDAGFNLAGFSVSAAGRLAYLAGGLEQRQLTWFDRTGKTIGVAGEPDANDLVSPALSPDGRRIAVTRIVQGNQDVWVIDALRGGATRLTFDPAFDAFAAWSPDGKRIAFESNRRGIYDLFTKSSTGTGDEELLLASPSPKLPSDWSLDGQFVLYQHGDPKNGWDLAAMPMMGERKPIVVVSAPFEERGGQFSPDGKWVAYQSNESGRFEIYVQPFPGPGDKWRVSIAGGTDTRWRADGQELFFLAPDGKLMAASVRASGTTFDAGPPAALFQTRMVVGGNANLAPQYAVSRDGRFLFNVPDETAPPQPITVIVNWNPGIRP
jgi:Tol biopolymer transport system component